MVNQRPFYERRFALPVRLPPCGVRGGQPKAQSPFLNLKGQPARVRVCVGLAAALRVLCRKCRQPLFEIGVVGLDFLDEKGRTVPMLPNFFEKISEWMGLI